mgnify:CR=1 FL=1
MSESQHIKDLRAVWGSACHTMWIELTALRCTATFVHNNYAIIADKTPLTNVIDTPESKGRLDSLTRSSFLEHFESYVEAVVTGRVVLLSAAFELYFRYFLDARLTGSKSFRAILH